MRREKYPTMIDSNGFLTLTDSGHDIWMRENNPDGWDSDTWKAFTERCSMDETFLGRCQAAKREGKTRLHPTADGWVPSKQFNPIAGLTERLRREGTA